jgi:hypothetical protein
MDAQELPNGNLLVPFSVQVVENGKVVTLGDGMKEVEPGLDEYEQWREYLDRHRSME